MSEINIGDKKINEIFNWAVLKAGRKENTRRGVERNE